MTMQRTVKVQINPPKNIALLTLESAKAIFDLHIKAGKEHGTWNKLKLHHLAYRESRNQFPNVSSSLVQTIRDTASEAIKLNKLRGMPTKRLRSGIRFNLRTFSLRDKTVSFSLEGLRWKEQILVPIFQETVWSSGKVKAATMTFDGRRFWLNIVFELPTAERIEGPAVGIDRGMLNLAVTSDGLFFKSKKIRAAQREALFTKRQLQSRGTRSADRRLTLVSQKEQRRTRDWNHVVSKRIASFQNCGLNLHADLNAAINIRDNYLSSLSSGRQASVNVPNAPRLEVEQAMGAVPVCS